ncbi:hypothetical protein [Acuticoccus mangrovi]|uniref:Sulfotransferase family protein n=1 Tax=Acuticoccus mangrovi TaxID=2796142 RepID=A0A934ILF0_9HYPH|nr:hypothetical protein [Acuticoccus mangrovi]MBJ3774075.1 hypothetical protein [Acuticoccus mangrovi]
MYFSIHIPKTAGTRFRQILAHRYGTGLALYYGPDNARTHSLARRKPHEFDKEMVRDLEAAGVRVLHGHFKARNIVPIVDDPSQMWVWLREPVEHVVSHYHFVRRQELAGNKMNDAVHAGDLSVVEFAMLDRVRTFQRYYCEGAPLSDYGFVGISELFPLALPLLGLHDTATGGNVNSEKPMADPEIRRAIAAILTDEFALYSEGMEILMRRLPTRNRRAGLLTRSARRVLDIARPRSIP